MNTEPSNEEFRQKPGGSGFRHLVNATRFSMQGLKYAISEESAFRQEVAMAMLLTPMAFYIGSNLVETAILLMVLLSVLSIELLNSGLEAIVDKTTPEHHELAGRAKDMGSAAIFVALVILCVTWTLLIIENFF